MTDLLPFAIAAVALTLVTLMLVLQPLWARQRPIALMLSALVLLSVAGLYQWVATPAALDPSARKPPETLEEAIAQLQASLKRDPNQSEGWHLLGRQYARMGNRDAAIQAYQRAIALDEKNPDLLAEAAEVRALTHPERLFDAEAAALLQRALMADPANFRARLLTGAMQRQAGQAAEAAATWESALAGLEGSAADALREQINEARSDAGLEPLPAPQPATAGAHAVPVSVDLSPAVAAQNLPADTTVFIIARIPDGPPMPVAAQRHRLADLPLRITLDDADSPMPTAKLSALPEVEILARISASGSAMPSDDDITSNAVRVRLPASGTVELTLGSD